MPVGGRFGSNSLELFAPTLIAETREENEVRHFDVAGALTISRTKFGVGRDEWRDTNIVGDEVGLQIEVLARRKK